MSKTLEELVEIAAEAYPDHFLQKQLGSSHIDVNALSLEEVLAAYVTREFRELYDADSSDHQNVRRIAASLERSAHTLACVAEQLREYGVQRDSAKKPEELPNPLERFRPASR